MSTFNTKTFEEFSNTLEHREKEIYVPLLRASINKVSCMVEGKLDSTKVDYWIKEAYNQYLEHIVEYFKN